MADIPARRVRGRYGERQGLLLANISQSKVRAHSSHRYEHYLHGNLLHSNTRSGEHAEFHLCSFFHVVSKTLEGFPQPPTLLAVFRWLHHREGEQTTVRSETHVLASHTRLLGH